MEDCSNEKALVVDVIIPERDYDSVFMRVFGIAHRTLMAEMAMRRLNGYCFLNPEGSCIYGDYSRTKEKLQWYDNVYLSQLFDYNIGSM